MLSSGLSRDAEITYSTDCVAQTSNFARVDASQITRNFSHGINIGASVTQLQLTNFDPQQVI